MQELDDSGRRIGAADALDAGGCGFLVVLLDPVQKGRLVFGIAVDERWVFRVRMEEEASSGIGIVCL